MVQLTAKLALVALLATLLTIDRVTARIYSQLDASGTRAVALPQATPNPRETSDGRAQGFRTTRVIVPTTRLTRYDPLIERLAAQSAFPADLVRAVVQVESGSGPTAISSAGAMGLMQLMPEKRPPNWASPTPTTRQATFAAASRI